MIVQNGYRAALLRENSEAARRELARLEMEVGNTPARPMQPAPTVLAKLTDPRSMWHRPNAGRTWVRHSSHYHG